MIEIEVSFVEHLLSECLKDKQQLACNEKQLFELSKEFFQLQDDNNRQMGVMTEYQREINMLKAQLESSK
jgi:hypothetical protein